MDFFKLMYGIQRDKVVKKITMSKFADFTYNLLTQIIKIDNFPKDLSIDVTNIIKLTQGMVGLLKYNDEYYIAEVSPSGLPRKDGRPYKVIAVWYDQNGTHTKECINDVDIVLWYNNALMLPEFFVTECSDMFTEIGISTKCNVLNARLSPVTKAKNESEKKQIEKAYEQIYNGKPQVITKEFNLSDLSDGDNDLMLRLTDVDDIEKVQFLSHLFDDYLKRICNIYGLSLNMSSKQAQQTEKEISGMEALSWMYPCDMLTQAEEFCKRAKNLYDLEMTAHFGLVHELNFKKFANMCTEKNNDSDTNICEENEESVKNKESEENKDDVFNSNE